jgi:hypothetical protein
MTAYDALDQPRLPEVEVLPAGPKGGASAHEFLEAVWNDPGVPLPLRIRAAVEALPYERPKLAATYSFHLGHDLDEAIARSEGRLPEPTNEAD